MTFYGRIGRIVEIRRTEAEELSVMWLISEFLSQPSGVGDWFDSPKFRFGDEHWFLSVWWTDISETENPASQCIGLHLGRCDDGRPKTFHVSVGISHSEGVEMEKEVKMEFPTYGGWYLKDFCSRYDLIRYRSRLMVNSKNLQIRCSIKVSKRENISEAETKHDDDGGNEGIKDESVHKASKGVKNSKQKNQEENTKKGLEKVVEDIGKMLASGENSDVTVQVGGTEFKVHSFILFARCPALSVSLRHESKEKVSDRIVIQDSEPCIFKDFLQYLYTGSVRTLTGQNVFNLYRIANKYLADDLKELCLEHIRGTLSVRTFCDAVQLAMTHRESELLEELMDFATRNIRLIRSVEWLTFNCDHPTEATEILIRALGPPSETQN